MEITGWVLNLYTDVFEIIIFDVEFTTNRATHSTFYDRVFVENQ